ncbi:Holliday junction DNA helicase RuvA [Cerasibacillus quisquiliarum]|uniref:Holliday junction branch migration complex subunit RuvA n=1 Tax=Cerasibacillus quisquiliarum TaxID=227865 RepID=A0A511UYZ3_9BACI|nr:Holliday junction branch migration protein RuvA [Cerasibacillus quisquiliarum]MBB5145616.1 Holliday junction DNA helicase RuvA [Cerasibacillus quisquiliarum]GEN30988.1 Holliday junction ATP-dependent DNA helicase RuvA [Cerasibacillus quisquiliarum]
MIAYIKGVLREILDESIIVEVNGIGYHIICPNPFIFQTSLNKEIKVYTYHHVREDAELLYGFQTQDEKKLFMQLISVSGIGPKGAIGIMANIDIAQFVAAIEREDAKYLTSFPGVGKKTSRQMILDLKGKLTSMFSLSTPDMSKDVAVQGSKDQYQEAKAALAALGYTDKEIKTVMPYIQKENIQETDAIIRKALTLFAKK